MFCGKCGRQLNDDAAFCIYCGHWVSGQNGEEGYEDPPPAPSLEHPLKKIVLGLSCVAALLLAALVFVMFAPKQSTYRSFAPEDIKESDGNYYIKDELIITAKEETKKGTISRLVKEEGGKIVGYLPVAEKYQIGFMDETSYEDLNCIAEELSQESVVVHADLHRVYPIMQNSSKDKPEDPWNNSQDDNSDAVEWSLDRAEGNNWWAEAIGLPSCWASEPDLSRIKVGIIDAGFDSENKEIRKAISKTWNNPDSDKDRDSVAEAYEKYRNLSDSEKTAYKGFQLSHGTHMAGIIAAERGTDFGTSGVFEKAKLYCYTLQTSDGEFEQNWGDPFELQYAVAQMLARGVRIVEVPLSFSQISVDAENGDEDAVKTVQGLNDDFEQFIKRYLKSGEDFLLVKSAGNNIDSSVNPRDAKYDFIGGIANEHVRKHVLLVGAASNHETYFTRADNSYSGDAIDVYAPGKYILSAFPADSTGVLSGTSTASAIVAGVAGLVWGSDKELESEDVRDIILSSVRYSMNEENTANPQAEHPERAVPLVNAYGAISLARAYHTDKESAGGHDGVLTGLIYTADESGKITALEDVTVTASGPSGSIDENSGKAMNYCLKLEPGTYTVELHKSGYHDVKFQVEIEGGKLACVDVKMEKKK